MLLPTVLATFCFFLAIMQTCAMTKDQAKTACLKELNINAEEQKLIAGNAFHDLVYDKLPKSLQCYSDCFYKKLGLLGADGQIKKPDVEVALTQMIGDKAKAVALMTSCQNPKGASECEKVFNFAACVHE